MWDHQRTPGKSEAVGQGSGAIPINRWRPQLGKKLTNGMPGAMGKVGVCVSPNPERIYANIEAEEGGVFRSDDGGKAGYSTTMHRNTVARAWYYTEIVADPQDEETVYVLNAPLLKSVDGGKSFTNI